ncbi:polyprenol phosphomannose-dependent alpha 1,6 mannosyltransferase MptB [Aeromicrobium sp. CF3.5]|uniref:polyprenol phosphomannose-dependent alpha 1,6 mannosyltransferase MptB n=1 Tax=Aeromicrobium sp. CF3.5 TaxID=3373078 RepID=UPI003EE6BB5E
MLVRGSIGSLLVLIGGLVVSVVPESSWVGDSALLQSLRSGIGGRMAGLSLVMLGLGLLAHAWLGLCRSVSHDEGDLRSSRLAAVCWSVPLLLAPPLFSRDGWSYAAQGALMRADLSPYEHGPVILGGPIIEAVDGRWLATMTPYGPIPLALGGGFAHVTTDPWLLVIAHRGVALLGVALLAWAVPRLAQWSGVNPALASAVVLASPLMMANGIGGLHNDLLMAGLMAVALVLAAEHGWVWGAVVGGLAAGVKAPGGLVCLGVVLVSLPVAASMRARLSRFVAVAGVSSAVLWLAGVLVGTGHGWIAALAVPGEVNTVLSITTVVGQAWGSVTVVRLVGTVVAVATLAWMALRSPTGTRPAATRAVAVAVGTVVVLGPVVHLWYFLWVLPFVATVRWSRPVGTAVLVLAVLLGLVAPLDSSLHGAYLAIVLVTMLAALLGAGLLLTPRGRERLETLTR